MATPHPDGESTAVLLDLPAFDVLGSLDELTQEGGHNNDDGWGYGMGAGVD